MSKFLDPEHDTSTVSELCTWSSSIKSLHIDSKLRYASDFSALFDLLLGVMDVEEQTSIGSMYLDCSQTIDKHPVASNRPVTSSQKR